MEPILLAGLASLLMGITLGVFGAGGSILTVPLLVYVLHFSPLEATHYSLFVVGIVSGLGVAWEWRSGDFRIGRTLWFALPAMASMFIMRNLLLPHLPREISGLGGSLRLELLLMIVFGIFMIAASFSMLFLKIKETNKAENKIALSFTGFFVGLVTGFVGAGGGFLIVPALAYLGSFSLKDAARASLFVIFLNSLWGFFSGLTGEPLPWGILFLVVGFAALGMVIGIAGRSRLPTDRLKPAFGLFVLLMGIFVLWSSL